MPHPKGKGKDHPLFRAVHDWLRHNFTLSGQCDYCGRTDVRTGFRLRRPDVREYAKDRNLFTELCDRCHSRRDHGWLMLGEGNWLCPRGHFWSPGGENDWRSPDGKTWKCAGCIKERNDARERRAS